MYGVQPPNMNHATVCRCMATLTRLTTGGGKSALNANRYGWDKVGTSNSLLTEGRVLSAAIARVRELHSPCQCVAVHLPQCLECEQGYPCATIRALDGRNESETS